MGRGRAKTLDKVLSNTREYLGKTFTSRDQFEICLGYGYDYNEAVEFRSRLEALLEELGLGGGDEIHITHISSVIAVHTGPYALGVGIIAKARLDSNSKAGSLARLFTCNARYIIEGGANNA